MKIIVFPLLTLVTLLTPAASLTAADLIQNGTFQSDAHGVITGWEKFRNPKPGVDLPAGFGNAPAKALYIEDAGGLTQTIKGLKEDQTYQISFRAWRRGGDWAPKPTLSLGGIPLPLQCEKLTVGAGNELGRNLEVYSLDRAIRPGAGDFVLKIEVFGDISGLTRYSELWLDHVALTPVEEKVELLSYPFEAIAYKDRALLRTGRPETIGLQLSNTCNAPLTAKVKLIAPEGVRVVDPVERDVSIWKRRDIYAPFIQAYGVPRKVPEKNPSATLMWQVLAEKPGDYVIQFEVNGERIDPLKITMDATFEPALENIAKVSAVPSPKPADTGDIKVGAMFYPGWVPGTGWGWSLLDPYPNRKPALGYYDDTEVEVIDWQIKWALEHGIQFFNVCWFRERGNEGKPVKSWRSDTLDNGLLKAKFLDQMGFAITWENQNAAGISSQADLLENLMPFWIENYLKHPSYLTFEGKPVLFIYSIQNMISQLGGLPQAKAALHAMRQQCIKVGLKGLIVAGEYRGDNLASQEQVRDSGFDAMWSYGIEDINLLHRRKEAAILPDIPTITVGWDPRPWQNYIGYWWTRHWQHTPAEFKAVAGQTKAIMESYPKGSIGRHIVQLDNWNEWGEGHWIAPSRHRGFSYLEAIRQVFAPASEKPINLLPEDLGMGGAYENAYERWLDEQKKALKR